MPNLTTSYLGLKLKNPLVVSSSGLTSSLDKIIQLEEKGVGAIVLKSLFEEQINQEVTHVLHQDLHLNKTHKDEDYLAQYVREHSLQTYLNFLREVKAKVKIPVIASVNCVSGEEWITFAKEIEKAGADALEINVFLVATDRKISSASIEYSYLDILTDIRKVINIPVSMKIGNNFTNLVAMVDKLYINGADGVVLFNRFYEPDINLDTLELCNSALYSSEADLRHTLRWIGIVSGKVNKINIAASTGIHDGEALIKVLLAGADVAQICSTLYLNGFVRIDQMLEQLVDFMNKWNYNQISDFKGKLNYSNIASPTQYERSQFIRYFSEEKN